MSDEYPLKDELDKVEDWDGTAVGLIEYLKQLWWCPEWGFKLTGKRVLKLELHTAGWSGNESIIYALQENWFWPIFWQKSRRGGHYYFKIELGLAQFKLSRLSERKKEEK